MDPIYYINLSQATDRRQRMEKRFKYHDLNYYRIDAIDKNSDKITQILEGFTLYPITPMVKAEAACLQSHLLALKEFTNTQEQYAVVCEDDIMLHNNFKDEYEKIKKNIPQNTNLIMLGHVVLYWDQFKWSGINPGLKNVRPIIKEITWGASCYRISKAYAIQIIEELDQPFKELQNKYNYVTSELIIKNSNGLLSSPPLVIDENSDSYIRSSDNLDINTVSSEVWGYFNYINGEEEIVSKLHHEHQQKLENIKSKYLDKKKLLWISRLGYVCSYSYVAYTLVPFLRDQYELSIFCTGIVHDDINRKRISEEFNLPLQNVHIIDKRLNNSENSDDHEYFNNYFNGIYHLEEVIRKSHPDIILSLDDNLALDRQWKVIRGISWEWTFQFIPYITVDFKNLTPDFFSFPVKKMLTMTQFGKLEISKIQPTTNIGILPHIVDHNVFYPLCNKEELQNKWLGRLGKFVIGAINANNTRKRWDILLEAFGEFARCHDDVILLMKVPYMKPKRSFGLSSCGEYDFTQLISQIYQKYKLTQDRIIIFEGQLTNIELNELYNCCDIGLTTTSGEGWGLIPCEMALCKVPQLIPAWSSFPEIFLDSSGLIPVKEWPIHIGRNINTIPESIIHQYIVIAKSYTYHENVNITVDNINHTKEIPTICISTNGNISNYKLHINVTLVAHLTQIKEAINFLKEYKYSDRLQILFGLEPSFLKRETQHLDELYNSLPQERRINYLLSPNKLNKYWDLSTGSVGLVSVENVVNTLGKFYSSPELRKSEGETQYERIRKLCDSETVLKQLDIFLRS